MCTAQWRQEDGVARGLEAPPLNVQDDRSDVLWSLRGLGRLLLWLLLRLLRRLLRLLRRRLLRRLLLQQLLLLLCGGVWLIRPTAASRRGGPDVRRQAQRRLIRVSELPIGHLHRQHPQPRAQPQGII